MGIHFRASDPGDGFEPFEETRSTGGSSDDDDIVPKRVAEYVNGMVDASLSYAKLNVYPSLHAYTAPDET